MDKKTCNLEIKKYTDLIDKQLSHFSGGHSITILKLSCKETTDNNYFIAVSFRHELTGNIDETSIDFIQANYL